MIGRSVFADSLAKTLAGQGVDVERADSASAATTADVLLPDLIVLAADAALSRGASVLGQLRASGRPTPTLVICALAPLGSAPAQVPPHVAYITPDGGVSDCARRVRALLVALLEDPSAGSSVQQLADRSTKPLGAAGPSGTPRAQSKAPAQAQLGNAVPQGAAGPKETVALRDTARPPKASVPPNKLVTQPNSAASGRTPAVQIKPAEPTKPVDALKTTTPLNAPKVSKESAPRTPVQMNQLHPTSSAVESNEVAAGTAKASAVDKPAAQPVHPPSAAASPLSAPQKAMAIQPSALNALGPARAANTQQLATKPAANAAAPSTLARASNPQQLAPKPAGNSAAPNAVARASNPQQLAPRPAGNAAALSRASLPRGLAVSQPAAASTSAQPSTQSAAQATLVAQPAAALREAEQASPRPLAAAPQSAPGLRVAQTSKLNPISSAGGPALPRAPLANDQQTPPAASTKTATGIAAPSAKQAEPAPTASSAHGKVASSVLTAQTTKQSELAAGPRVQAVQPQTGTKAAATGSTGTAQAAGPLPVARAAAKPTARQAATPAAAATPLTTAVAAPRATAPLAAAAEATATASTKAVPRAAAAGAAAAPTTTALAASPEQLVAAVGGAAPSERHDSIRASEIEIAISMSEPPPAASEATARDARPGAAVRARAQMPPTLPTPQTKSPFEETSARASSEPQDLDLEMTLSDPPLSLAAAPLPAATAPLPAASDLALTPRAGTPNAKPAQRVEPAKPQTRPQPTATNDQRVPDRQPAGAARVLEPLPTSTATSGALHSSSAQTPAHPAARTDPQPSAAHANHSVMGAGAPNLPASQALRDPIEPAATALPTLGASGPSAASAREAQQPARVAASATSASGASSPKKASARAPRHPFEPAARATDPATSATGPSKARAPRHPFEPAARATDPATSATGPNKAPARAPRYPFEPAARAADAAMSASIVTARPPRYPFEPAAYAAESPINASRPSAATARPPRYPFEPAARATDPQLSASDANAPSVATVRPPGYPFEPGARAAEPPPLAARRTNSARTRKGRTKTRPFEPARAAQSSVAMSDAEALNVATTTRPEAPALPEAALTPATLEAAKPRSPRRFWVLGAVAAISCSAFLLYRTYDGFAAVVPGNPAAGALVQTPALVASPEPLAPEPAVVPVQALEPSPSAAGTESAERGSATPTDSRATARRAGAPREADPTTAAGRARALVDTGSAMLRQGRLGLAESMYMKALQEVPEYPAAMAELVRVHLARRDGMEAVRWADRLVNKQNNALAQLLLGDAQALRGNSGAAQAAWTKAADAGNATARQRLDDDE